MKVGHKQIRLGYIYLSSAQAEARSLEAGAAAVLGQLSCFTVIKRNDNVANYLTNHNLPITEPIMFAVCGHKAGWISKCRMS